MATRDFTKKRDEITFVIAPDTFRAYPGLSADTLVTYADRLNDVMNLPVSEQFALYKEVLAELLEPDSYERFVARMGDRQNPIDTEQLNEVTSWLFEQYGMRPTEPSSPSPSGPPSPEPGTGSTESTPVEVSISDLSLPIAS